MLLYPLKILFCCCNCKGNRNFHRFPLNNSNALRICMRCHIHAIHILCMYKPLVQQCNLPGALRVTAWLRPTFCNRIISTPVISPVWFSFYPYYVEWITIVSFSIVRWMCYMPPGLMKVKVSSRFSWVSLGLAN